MKYELKLHRITFGILMVLLVAFVAFLLYVRPGLANDRLEVITSLLLVIVAAATFLTMGIIEGAMAFQFRKPHIKELLSYLSLGLLSLMCGLYLSISDSASLQTVALVAAPHAVLFGLAELRMSQHLERHPGYKRALIVGGTIELSLAASLIDAYRLPSKEAAIVLSFVAVLSILQLFPLLFYWRTAKPHITH